MTEAIDDERDELHERLGDALSTQRVRRRERARARFFATTADGSSRRSPCDQLFGQGVVADVADDLLARRGSRSSR